MFVIRKKLTPDEITPPTIRYNVDCDCIQTTFDGGDTWTDSPGSDPRSSPAFRAPANATADPRCNAAANMVALLQQLIAADLAADNAAALVVLWFGILVFAFPFLGWVADLLLLIADGIITIGATAINSAFTPTVYDDLLCVFLNHIDDDGQMSDAQLADIYSDIAAEFDLTVQAVFGLHSSALGAVGWSNAGALGTETGDCSGCCHDLAGCFIWDFQTTENQLGWAVDTSGRWNAGGAGLWIYAQTCAGGVGSDSDMDVVQVFPSSAHAVFTSVEIDLDAINNPVNWEIYQIHADTTETLLLSGTVAAGSHTQGGTVSADCYGLRVKTHAAAGCGATDCFLSAVRVLSDDFCPLGVTPNC